MKTNETSPTPTPSETSVYINLNDTHMCESWIRAVQEAGKSGAKSLEIVFLGGGDKISPSILLSLRNAIERVPDSVFVRTVAMGSLPPFACVAWLSGDERHIARDARVWIDDYPESLLRGILPKSVEPGEEEESGEAKWHDGPDSSHEDDSDEEPDMDSLFRKRRNRKRQFNVCDCPEEHCACGRKRFCTDVCSVVRIINEWFPCWEYAGMGIHSSQLVEMRVIREEWIFGERRGRRGRIQHLPAEQPASTHVTERANPREIPQEMDLPFDAPPRQAPPEPDRSHCGRKEGSDSDTTSRDEPPF
jgi:hypothetical protein